MMGKLMSEMSDDEIAQMKRNLAEGISENIRKNTSLGLRELIDSEILPEKYRHSIGWAYLLLTNISDFKDQKTGDSE